MSFNNTNDCENVKNIYQKCINKYGKDNYQCTPSQSDLLFCQNSINTTLNDGPEYFKNIPQALIDPNIENFVNLNDFDFNKITNLFGKGKKKNKNINFNDFYNNLSKSDNFSKVLRKLDINPSLNPNDFIKNLKDKFKKLNEQQKKNLLEELKKKSDNVMNNTMMPEDDMIMSEDDMMMSEDDMMSENDMIMSEDDMMMSDRKNNERKLRDIIIKKKINCKLIQNKKNALCKNKASDAFQKLNKLFDNSDSQEIINELSNNLNILDNLSSNEKKDFISKLGKKFNQTNEEIMQLIKNLRGNITQQELINNYDSDVMNQIQQNNEMLDKELEKSRMMDNNILNEESIQEDKRNTNRNMNRNMNNTNKNIYVDLNCFMKNIDMLKNHSSNTMIDLDVLLGNIKGCSYVNKNKNSDEMTMDIKQDSIKIMNRSANVLINDRNNDMLDITEGFEQENTSNVDYTWFWIIIIIIIIVVVYKYAFKNNN